MPSDRSETRTCLGCGYVGTDVGLTSSGPRCLGCFMYGDKKPAAPTPAPREETHGEVVLWRYGTELFDTRRPPPEVEHYEYIAVPAAQRERERALIEALPTRGDVGRPEATRDPVFLLRYRHPKDSPDKNRWHVDSVWFTREEAEQFAANHAHRWGKDKHGPRWHVYCLPANGDLAALLKAVTNRDASLRGKEAPRG